MDVNGSGPIRRALQKREREYYEQHPQKDLKLTPTEWTSPYGMPVYEDQHGQRHSESSSTFKTPEGKWTTAPVIYPDPVTGKARYFEEDELADLLGQNGWNNPVTGEALPMFDTEPEATDWAVDRDLTLQNKNLPYNK